MVVEEVDDRAETEGADYGSQADDSAAEEADQGTDDVVGHPAPEVGDMQAFVQKLRDMGYECVELIDTTDGSFMTPKEAGRLMLRGSTLLVGRK